MILRLTPFKFAVTVADPFSWNKIVSGNGKYGRLAGVCIFDGQTGTAFRLIRERMLTLEPTLSVVLEARKVATVFEDEVTFPVSLQAAAFG